MNKVVIIGNGFDLAHNLRTNYSHFILWYFNKIVTTLSKGINIDDPLIQINTTIPDMIETIESIEDLDKLHQYLQQASHIVYKVKSKFFNRLFSQLMDVNWVDIEAIFYQELVIIYNYAEGNPGSKEHIMMRVNALNKELEFLHEELCQYLSDKVITDSKIVNNRILSKLRSALTSTHSGDKALFVIFNYTNTIDYYIRELESLNPNVIYIHGQLNDFKNPTIFGYGDEMDKHFRSIELLNENGFLKNMKTFHYHTTNNYKKMIGFLSKGMYKVILMGHSCGLSDRILLNKIFENKNCNSIQLYYYKKNESENDFNEKMFEIYRHFSTNSKDLMLERMVSFENSEPL
jgi:hypothetical protein